MEAFKQANHHEWSDSRPSGTMKENNSSRDVSPDLCKSAINRKWELGGVDLIQFITALMILAIAAATATFSLYIGRGNLNHEWRKKRALELARDEVEYWTGMTYEGQGGEGIPYNLRDGIIEHQEILDFRGPNNGDDIICRVQRLPVQLNIILSGGADVESYLIRVNVIWEEPFTDNNQSSIADTVNLHTWMVFGQSISGGSSASGTPPQ